MDWCLFVSEFLFVLNLVIFHSSDIICFVLSLVFPSHFKAPATIRILNDFSLLQVFANGSNADAGRACSYVGMLDSDCEY
jgi:hypothetical protein